MYRGGSREQFQSVGGDEAKNPVGQPGATLWDPRDSKHPRSQPGPRGELRSTFWIVRAKPQSMFRANAKKRPRINAITNTQIEIRNSKQIQMTKRQKIPNQRISDFHFCLSAL